MRRLLKILHELGTVGAMGAMLCCVVLAAIGPVDAPVEFAAIRRGMAAITGWVLVPSLGIVLVSGLLALAQSEAYRNAGWAWVKALSGVVVFEGTLVTIDGRAQQIAELATARASNQGDADAIARELADALAGEWGGLWVLLALCLLNVVLGVWRPRRVVWWKS